MIAARRRGDRKHRLGDLDGRPRELALWLLVPLIPGLSLTYASAALR